MGLHWNGEQVTGELERKVAEGLLRAAKFFVNVHRIRLNVPYPPASKPGEYPHRRSGRGQASTAFSPQTVEGVIKAGLKVQIGYREMAGKPLGNYLYFLEVHRARLGLKKTAADYADRLAAMVRRGV